MRKELKETVQKLKPKHKLTSSGMIALAMVICFAAVGLFVYFTKPNAIDKLSLTYLDNLSSSSLAYDLQDSFEDSYKIRDFTIYGESLGLYENSYESEDRDGLYGKNVMLKNLETGQERMFNFGGGIDGGVDLGMLDPGVYEVYVYDNYTQKRVYCSQPIESEVFTTVRRDKEVNDIILTANKDYLEKFGVEMDRNYLFLTVTDSLPRVKVVDVMIDPSGLVSYMNGPGVAEGYVSDVINEAQASYSLAEKIQQYLQDAGLKVEISRGEDQDLGYYGAGSRIGLGYQKQAKVFLGLTMTDSEEVFPYLLTSPLTNGSLANAMAYKLHQNGVELANVTNASYLDSGAALDQTVVDEKGQLTRWSATPQIRETGGKATFAGTNDSWKANSGFAQSNGMYGVVMCYATTVSADSQMYFLDHEDAIAKSLAEGILDYFHIDAEGGSRS